MIYTKIYNVFEVLQINKWIIDLPNHINAQCTFMDEKYCI